MEIVINVQEETNKVGNTVFILKGALDSVLVIIIT